jgi:hypothetical protein
MADKKEAKDPDYIVKHKKLYEHATRLVDTATHTHTKAYNEAVDKHLMKDGEVDLKLLDDANIQEKFSKTMADVYVAKAKKQFKVSKDLNQLERSMLMQSYSGTTEHEIKGLVTRNGKRLNHQRFISEALNRYVPQLEQNLYAAAGQHLKDKDIGSIVKYVGLADKVDSAQVDRNEAAALLRAHHEDGVISDSALRNSIPSHKRKKKSKK